jgi:hypothetical protein
MQPPIGGGLEWPAIAKTTGHQDGTRSLKPAEGSSPFCKIQGGLARSFLSGVFEDQSRVDLTGTRAACNVYVCLPGNQLEHW